MSTISPELNPLELAIGYQNAGMSPVEDQDHHLRLSVQGGGMAGVVTLGMLDVLEGEGLIPYFRGLDSISAGAMNASAALSGQIATAKELYIETLTSKENGFVKLHRLHRIVDLSVLRGFITELVDVDAILNHPTELGVGLTHRQSQQPVAVNSKSLSRQKLTEHLCDAVQLPLAGGFTRREHTDGGTSWRSTPDISRHFGATDILDLSNSSYKTWKYYKWPSVAVDIFNTVTSGRPRNIGKFCTFAVHQRDYMNSPPAEDTTTIYPEESAVRGLNALTTDRVGLNAGFNAGQDAAIAAIRAAKANLKITI